MPVGLVPGTVQRIWSWVIYCLGTPVSSLRFCKTEAREREGESSHYEFVAFVTRSRGGLGSGRDQGSRGWGGALEGGGRVRSQGFGRMLEEAGKQVSRDLRTPLGPLLDFSPLGSLDS